jgi:cell division protein FtsW (lipid II flippase)
MSIFISTGGSMVKIISTITGFLLENQKTVP